MYYGEMDNPYAPPAGPPALPSDDIARALQGLQYPLKLSFKIMALASQATMVDASGRTVLYTKQKLLKFREHVEIFTDSTRSTRLADIHANKVIDWSARYFSTDATGKEIGSVGRRGWRSMRCRTSASVRKMPAPRSPMPCSARSRSSECSPAISSIRAIWPAAAMVLRRCA
jgi:hypothetical protein